MSEQKPKVLILVDWFWPGFRAGGPIQSCLNLVRWLRDDVDFSIITTNKDYLSSESYQEVPADQWTTVLEGIRVYYASPDSLKYKALKKLIEGEEYDFLLLNSMFSVPFTIYPLWMMRKRGLEKVILAPRGMLAQGALSIKSRKKTLFLKLFRLFGFPHKLRFWATSQHEKEDIKRAFGKSVKVRVAPNLPAKKQPALTVTDKIPGRLKLVSISRISPEKNNKMIFKVLQGVKSDVVLDLYGPISNPDYWAACQQAIRNLPANVRVEHHGQIPKEEVAGVVRNAHFYILATLGENFGHAIFESLSLGRPVIISDTTPWKELESRKAGWDIPLLDKAGFSHAIETASAMEQDEFNIWCENAWKFAQEFIENSELKEANLRLFGK